jgi:hypothetical protein
MGGIGDEYVGSLIDVRHNEDNVQGLSIEEIIIDISGIGRS